MLAAVLNGLKQELTFKEQDVEKVENELIVDVLVAGLNRRDHWIIKGLYPGIQLPCILGSDGVVSYEDKTYIINPNEHWGSNNRIPSKEYRIRGLEKPGTFATQTSVLKSKLFVKPAHLTDSEAAILPLGGLTAYRALVSNCAVKAGDKVLINGIGGGVALLAFQFAIALGAEVYVSSSSQEKIDDAVELGAKGGLNYTEEGWGKRFRKEVGGFDVIIDSAGGDGFVELIAAANDGCRIGIFGGTRGTINNISPQHLFFKQIHIFGSTMGSDQEFAAMVRMVDRLKIHPIVDSIYPFAEINEAIARMLSNDKFGKVAVRMPE